jgi:hypothetical protein
LTGNVTGNVTGDLTGDVTGDVTGNVTGDVTGNVTGDVTGNVTGDLTGNVTGNVTGDLTGDVTGDVTGNVTGDLTGDVTGDVTGNVTGDLTGDVTGDVTGNVTGDLTGDVTGNVTGNTFIFGTQESISTSSGALVVSGGVGVNSNLHVGGDIYGNIVSASTLTDGQATITGNVVTASTLTDGQASLSSGNCIVNNLELVEGMNIVLGQKILDLMKNKTILGDGTATDLGSAPIGSYTLYTSPISGSGNAVSQFAVCNNNTNNEVSRLVNAQGTNGNIDANITSGNILVFTDGSGTGNVSYDFAISGIFNA